MSVDGAGERRADRRHDIDLPVVLRAYRIDKVATRAADISAGGALVAARDASFMRGDELSVEIAGLVIVATVAWRTENFLGLAFHRPLAHADLAAIRRRGA